MGKLQWEDEKVLEMVVGLFHMAWMCLMPLNCPLKYGVFHVRHLWLRQ